ncbi:MAG: radical SAM protein [Oscillospiraceae bacterium]|nr:radical SAM protein [Oscillospiraceae bacterium]
MITGMWLTLNRACNFRCPWCYAQNTEYEKNKTMSLDLAQQLIKFAKLMDVKTILLIGGEPTYHPHIIEILELIKRQKIYTTIVTNGYRLHDKNFAKELKNLNHGALGFSIKAANREQHKELTGTDTFEEILEAMANIREAKLKVGYTTVISRGTIDNLEEFAYMLKKHAPGKSLRYSLCNPAISNPGIINRDYVVPAKEITRKVAAKWGLLSEILECRVRLEQSLPQCVWPVGFIDMLKKKKQVSFGCHIMSRKGMIFDTEGKLLVCNSLTDYPIAEFGKTFDDKESFEKFWENEELKDLYKKFYEYPMLKCETCDVYSECGGGCPLKHFEKVNSKVK